MVYDSNCPFSFMHFNYLISAPPPLPSLSLGVMGSPRVQLRIIPIKEQASCDAGEVALFINPAPLLKERLWNQSSQFPGVGVCIRRACSAKARRPKCRMHMCACGLALMSASVAFLSQRLQQQQALCLHQRPIQDKEHVEAKAVFSLCSQRSCHVCRVVPSFPSINYFSFCCDGISDKSSFSNSSLGSQLEKRISSAHEWGGETQAWTWPLVIVRLVPSTTSVYTCMRACLCGTSLWGQRSMLGTVLWTGACAVGVADWSLSSRELHAPAFPVLALHAWHFGMASGVSTQAPLFEM